jgi:VIT1/CCC1 family predicted Fe2+/Mn2+ transporter
MSRLRLHPESHLGGRIGWLRAAVLGANDGIVSTASLIVGVAAASLGFLALLGAIGASAGGANVLRATARVTFWSALAMALTAGIGKLFGTVV